MRNALLLAGIWVAIILVAYAVAYMPDRTPDYGILSVDRRFESASGAFGLPVPAGWSVLETDYGAEIASPVGTVEGWVVVATGTTAEEALADGWLAIDPCPSCTRPTLESSAVETTAGQTRMTFAYAPSDDGTVVHGVLLGADPQWAALFFETGAGSVPSRVSAGVSRMEEGLTVPATPGGAEAAI